MTGGTLALRGESDEVSSLELFFDLVFVFAISQFSQLLLADRSAFGAARALVLFVAVYNVWLATTWSACLHDTRQRAMQVLLLFVMVAGLFMNATIGGAFEKTPLLFVALYLTTNVVREIWLVARTDSARMRDHYKRMTIWHLIGGVFWIAGAFAPSPYRLALWAAGASLDLTGNILAHPLPGWRMSTGRLEAPFGRLLERARLFFLIALGETLLTTGTAIAAHADEPLSLLAGLTAAGVSIALWWAYFDTRDGHVAAALEAADNPTQTAIWTYNGLFVVVAALICIAVANEIVIAHPLGHADLPTILMMYGGPILYLATHAWHSWRAVGKVLRSRLIAVGALVALGFVAPHVAPVVALIGAAAPLIAVAFADTWLSPAPARSHAG